MAFKIILQLIVIHFWVLTPTIFAQDSKQFIYQGFQQANLHLDGAATVAANGLLQLTNYSKQLTAHAFHPQPLNFSSSSSLSFSTHYVFAMYPEIQSISGHGIVFVLSPSMSFPHGVPGKFFGLFNSSSDFMPSDHIFAVELDTIQDFEFSDLDSNHVGININSLISNASASAAYFSDAENVNRSLNLLSARRMQIWIDYNHENMLVQVTMAPIEVPKPSRPLLSFRVNLSEVLSETMYVGFSSSTGSVASSHYLLGWSFAHGGETAQRLDLSKLPRLPRYGSRGRKLSVGSMILVIVISVIVITVGLIFYVIRRKKYEELIEDWEKEYLLQRFSFKDLYRATKGFKDKEVLGAGGFGKVYKGNLTCPKLEVAVKRVSHGSGQGMREFMAEVACMGRLRHRNLVQLLGNPQTTHVVGTVGYLAPELTRKGKATTCTDVFSFGVFILEVACGRSPITLNGSNAETYLIEWVYECWKTGVLIEAGDPKLGGNYVVDEMELILRLGMFCCHPRPEGRPNMRQVMQFLNRDNTLPEMIPFDAKAAHSTSNNQISFPTSSVGNSAYASYSSESILQVGR
ncbi:hypothetical protein SOVF_055000 [Spinacia oleracea]|nr:hypothetical protein SOVF_055000 [Spinacia oleracea]